MGCAGCLDLLFIKGLLTEAELDEGKLLLRDIVCLLVGLIRSQSPDRLREEGVEYGGRGGESKSKITNKSGERGEDDD